MKSRESEWQDLYAEILQKLTALGEENAYGAGDFWLVDDDYGDLTQKICIHRKSFLSPDLVPVIQCALQAFPQWRVMLQLEFDIRGVARATSGLCIHSNRIERHLDQRHAAEISALLGIAAA